MGAAQLVGAPQLVEELQGFVDGTISIRRNGNVTSKGRLLSATLVEPELAGRGVAPVVLLVLENNDAGETTVVGHALVCGQIPDADYFWPVCPITARRDDRGAEWHLR